MHRSQLLAYRFMTYRAGQDQYTLLDWLAARGGLTEGDISRGWIIIWVPLRHEVVLLNLWGQYLERLIDRDL